MVLWDLQRRALNSVLQFWRYGLLVVLITVFESFCFKLTAFYNNFYRMCIPEVKFIYLKFTCKGKCWDALLHWWILDSRVQV